MLQVDFLTLWNDISNYVIACIYSGAWMGHISHLMDNPKLVEFFPDGSIESAKSQVRCEDASFFFFHKMFDTRIIDTWGESPVQTIDMFDFSGTEIDTSLSSSPPSLPPISSLCVEVLHLSSTERLLHSCVNRTKEGWVRPRLLICPSAVWMSHLSVYYAQTRHGREMDGVLKSLSHFIGPKNADKIRSFSCFVLLLLL